MIADGAVQGYVVAELGYTYDQNAKVLAPATPISSMRRFGRFIPTPRSIFATSKNTT